MINKKLMLLDIDGTLFDNRNRRVPDSAIAAVKEASAKMKIGIATGRAGFMLHSIDAVLPYVDYFVFINGQFITAKNKLIYESPIPADLIESVIRDMETFDIAYGFESSDEEAISKIDDKVIQSFIGLDLNLPPINKEFYRKRKVYQLWSFCTPEIAARLAGKHPYFQFIRWLEVGYDILPKEASKGLGMKHLLDYLNIDPSEVIAIGDGDNDYEMIRDAGIGIAMGNATDRVKKVSDYITDDVGRDGLYKALQHYKIVN